MTMMKFLPSRLRMPVHGDERQAAKATLWPVAVLVGLIPVSLVAGWVLYRDRPDGHQQQAGH